MLMVKSDSAGFSGCNIVSGIPNITPIMISVNSQTIVSNATTLNNTSSGTIDVVIENSNAALDLCSSQSLTELSKRSELAVFPNPSAGNFEIKNLYSEISIVIIKVVDLYGKCVFTTISDLQNEKVSLDLKITEGIYFLHILETSSNKEFIKKVVILR